MKSIIRRNENSKMGYEIIIKNENNEIIETKEIEIICDDGKTLKLPENPSNRKYFSIKKVEESGGEIELSYKESIKMSPRTLSNNKKIEDYLTEEEKEKIQEIMNNAKKRMEEEKEKTERIKNNPRYKELIKIRKDMENLRNLGIEIPEENFNRINEELEKMGI